MGAFKQRKEKRKWCNYIIMSKKIKEIILKTNIASRVQIGNTVQVTFVSICL